MKNTCNELVGMAVAVFVGLTITLLIALLPNHTDRKPPSPLPVFLKDSASATNSPTGLRTNMFSAAELWLVSKLVTAQIVLITDESYLLVPKKNWKDYFPPRELSYSVDRWDCDDYAIDALNSARLHHAQTSTNDTGIAVGVIAYRQRGKEMGHAANIVMLDNGTVFIYDGQLRRSIPLPPDADILFVLW